MSRVTELINSFDLCEVHFRDSDGRIVATIEGENIEEQRKRFIRIQNIPEVVNANLMFSYYVDELTEAMEQTEQI